MKVLFVLENLTSSCAANVTIVTEIVKRIQNSESFYCLAREDASIPLDTEKEKLFQKVILVQDPESTCINEMIASTEWKHSGVQSRCLKLLKNPKRLFYAWDLWMKDCSLTEKVMKNAVEQCCAEYSIDVVIGVAMPYYIVKAVAKADIEAKKIALQLDPFTYNHALSLLRISARKVAEIRTIQELNLVLSHPAILSEMRSYLPPTVHSKLHAFEFPGITREEKVTGIFEKALVINHQNGIIKCAFIGSFYRDIRNPKYLLELFCVLPKNYELHIIGGGAESVVEMYKAKLGNRLVQHGYMSSADAQINAAEADILVNVNNSISNQIPSKIFQYINTGKPILNICKLNDCPSLPYMRLYDNALSVFESETLENASNKIIQFSRECLGKTLSKKYILRTFEKNTYDYAASLIVSELEVVIASNSTKQNEISPKSTV